MVRHRYVCSGLRLHVFISLGADVAKEIYRNITAEKLALVRFLTEREKNAVATQRSWAQANQVSIP